METNSNNNLETLRNQGRKCLEELDPEKAIFYLHKALTIDENDIPSIDLMAESAIELEEHDLALQMLQRSTQLKPNENPTKWMYYGQLQKGKDAISSFEKGISLMLLDRTSNQSMQTSEGVVDITARPVSSGYCSMAEIYVTDLCDEPNAESECERLLALAVKEDPTNSEAYHMLANLRMIQGNDDKANECLQKCIDLLPNNIDEGDPQEEIGYNSRINIAKLCIELNKYEEAVHLFDTLLDEDEHFVEVWYLLGRCHNQLKNYQSAAECLTKAEDMLLKLEDNSDAEELLKPVRNLLKQLPNDLVNKAMLEWTQKNTKQFSKIYDDDDDEMMEEEPPEKMKMKRHKTKKPKDNMENDPQIKLDNIKSMSLVQKKM